MVGVGIEAGAGAAHPTDERDRRSAAGAPTRSRDAAGDAGRSGEASWIATYAGLSRRVTYCTGEAVESQRRWFGSFQIVQWWTNG